jgi:hypothetical protein
MDLYIDPELQAVIPPPTDQESAQLEANLLADGCRDPLVVWAGEPPAQVCPSCPPGTPYSRATALIEAREGTVVWMCGFCDHGEQRLGRCSTATSATTSVAPMTFPSPSSRRRRGCGPARMPRSG